MKINKINYTFEQLMMAKIVDAVSMMLWSKSKDGQKGINRPKSVVEKLINPKKTEVKDDVLKFDSIEEFELAKKKILERG